MKKFIFVVALLSATVAGFAQTAISVEAGANFSYQHNVFPTGIQTIRYVKDNSDWLTKLRAGVAVSFPLCKNYSLGTGLYYSPKGRVVQMDKLYPEYEGTARIRFSFLELPVYLEYKTKAGPGGFTFGAGGYVGYAMTGRSTGPVYRSDSTGIHIAGVSTANLYGNGNGYRRFDAGPAMEIAYSLPKHLYVKVVAEWGLTNLYHVQSAWSEARLKTRNVGVTVGYTLWAKS